MSGYPELESSTTREIDGVVYHVRKFGYGGKVYEEELVPVVDVKTVTVLNVDGSVNNEKSYTVLIK